MAKIDINIILKLPVWQRLLILGGLWLIIVGGFYYVIYSAKLAEKSKLNAQLVELKADAEKKQKIADDLPRLKKEREELLVKFQRALAQLPNEKEIANLLESLHNAARDSRLDVLLFKPGKEVPKGFYAEVTIDMKVEGSFSSMVAFFNKVADLPRIVNVSSLNIASGKETKGEIMLSVTFLAVTFKFIPQS